MAIVRPRKADGEYVWTTVCTRAWELTWARPTSVINPSDSWNDGEAAKATTLSPYSVAPQHEEPPREPVPEGRQEDGATQRAEAHSRQESPLAGGPDTQEVARKHRQEGREGDDEQRGAHHDEEPRAYRFVAPTERPPLDDALAEGCPRRGAAAPTGGSTRVRAKLQGPDDRQQIEPYLNDVAARRAERGDEEAC